MVAVESVDRERIMALSGSEALVASMRPTPRLPYSVAHFISHPPTHSLAVRERMAARA